MQGGVATGKSTVSNMFRDLGVPVIDAGKSNNQIKRKDSVGCKMA